MPKKNKKVGRPKESDKIRTEYIYIRESQKKKILKKFDSLTKAVTDVVLPMCQEK